MKKLIALILTLVLALTMCACGSKEPDPDPVPDDKNPSVITPTPDAEQTPDVTSEQPEATPEATPTPTPETTPTPTPSPTPGTSGSTAAKTPDELTTMMETIIEGADEVNSGAISELPKDNDTYLYNLYIEYVEGYECVTYAPMMSSTAYFVALVSVPSDVDAEDLAATIEAGADPNKWICVSADQVVTAVNGNVILFYMVDSNVYPTTEEVLTTNFAAL